MTQRLKWPILFPMNRRDFLFALFGVLIAVGIGVVFTNLPSNESSPRLSSEAPLIGIASLSSDSYVLAIREAGGIPVVLPNGDGNGEKVAAYLDLIDGLLMPGGADIPPSEWGEEPHPTTELLSEDRYLFEKELITRWIEDTEKPLLGICLGSQWINVAHGGSLVQDIPSEFEVNHRDRDHAVILESDSRLSRILGETTLEVNSMHHQAVREVGAGLRIVARCPDGIAEAVETVEDDRFLVGVQWHPERMAGTNERQRKIFSAFVQSAREHREKRSR